MGKKAPKAPDPYALSQSQTETNINTAQAQQKLGMTGQETPWGSINYVADPNSPSGYRAVTQLSQGQQGLMDQNEQLQGQIGGLRGEAMDRIGSIMGTPFDMNAERGRELTDIQRTMMDPQWAQRDTSAEARLLNRGIRPGSEQYENMTRQHGQQRNDAYNQMYLSGYTTANNAALQERNQPFQEFAAIGGATPTAAPTGVNPAAAPTPGVAPTDLAGNVNNAYNQQMQQYNQQMGGMYGLGGSLLGGWASKGFPGLSFLSDRRMKYDIDRIADDDRGFGIYRFKYIGEDVENVGVMADEIEKVMPEAVFTSQFGIKIVDYSALGM